MDKTLPMETLAEYTHKLHEIFQEKLMLVVLFGSYARGENTSDSDIDILALVDGTEQDLEQYRHRIASMSFEFNLEYDTDIQLITMSTEYYHKWQQVHPLLTNIERDKAILYERCF